MDVDSNKQKGDPERVAFLLHLIRVKDSLHFLWRQPAMVTVKPLFELTLLIPPDSFIAIGQDYQIPYPLAKTG